MMTSPGPALICPDPASEHLGPAVPSSYSRRRALTVAARCSEVETGTCRRDSYSHPGQTRDLASAQLTCQQTITRYGRLVARGRTAAAPLRIMLSISTMGKPLPRRDRGSNLVNDSLVTTLTQFHIQNIISYHIISNGWLGSRVVSVLDSGAEGPGLKSQPRCCRVTVLGKLFTPTVPLFNKQRKW